MNPTTKQPADQRVTRSVPEVARMLGISRGAAYAAVRNGELPSLKVGNRVLVPLAKLQQLIGEV